MTRYDVLIVGGGLAGLTLSLQLRRHCPQLSVAVVERKRHPLPEAAHKVGESTVEIGAWYFAEVLGLRDYLLQRQLRKQGLRFFFDSGSHDDLAQADELGTSALLQVPSYQLDRGRFENDLADMARAAGVTVLDGVMVTQVEIGEGNHSATLRDEDGSRNVQAHWLVDAASRASPIKRTLKLARENDHHCDAVWFRTANSIRLDGWSSDREWQARGPGGKRWLSTNHLMGPGYWVWLIPLSSGTTSVGIVADPAVHPLDTYDSYDKAMAWLDRHQPRCARAIREDGGELLDFRFLRHYSHDCRRVYSSQRWALTGEAGVFLDPFYSPGSDFIGISNTYITDLIASEQAGEDIDARARRYQSLYYSFYQSTLSLYQDQYPGFGDRRLMVAKITWDYAYYWSVLALLFCQGRIADLDLFDTLLPELGHAQAINRRLQARFAAVGRQRQVHPAAGMFFDQVHMPLMVRLNRELIAPIDRPTLKARLRDNVQTLERLADELGAYAEHGTVSDWLEEQLGLGRAVPMTA